MKVIYIPSGPGNLQTVFPSVAFNLNMEYYVQLKTAEGDILITSKKYRVVPGCIDKARIHFLNALGTIDAVNFPEVGIVQETSSEQWKRAPTVPLQKQKHSITRFNVQANDTYVATTSEYGEKDMVWLEELFNAPLAWLEWKGTQGQPDNYIPIVISNGKHEKLKVEDRYLYQVEIQFTLSHPKFILR